MDEGRQVGSYEGYTESSSDVPVAGIGHEQPGRSRETADEPPGSRALAGGPAVDNALTSTARGSITVAAWTMISRITGLLRVVVIGAVLGPTFFANAFLSANTVPNLIYTMLAGPVLALVLVPALTRSLVGRGVAASGELLSKVAGYLMFWAAIMAGAIAAASPLVAWALTAGIPDAATRWRAWWLTILIILCVAPQVLGYTLASIGAAAQQTRRRFVLSSAAPALENVGLIATMAVVALWYRPGVDVPDVPLGMVCVLGVGSTLSVAAHAAAQLFGARRVGLSVRVRRGWSLDVDARGVSQRLRRSVVVAVFPVCSMFVMMAVAATVPGGVFVVDTALSLYGVIGALGAKAVTVAALPGMSQAAGDDAGESLGTAWRQALNYSVMASLPAMCLSIAFAGPMAATLANGELNRPLIVGWLTSCLMVIAVAQFANAGYEVTRQTLFARLDTTGPRRTAAVMATVRIIVALACLLAPAGGARLVGLCLGVLLGDVTSAIVGLLMVRAVIRPERFVDVRQLNVIICSTLAMLPASVLGWWVVSHFVHDRVPRVLVSLALGAVALTCFVLTYAALTRQMSIFTVRVRALLRG